MERYVGCHVMPRGGYRPRHLARRTADRPPYAGGLIVAVGVTITGMLLVGGGVAIQPRPNLAVAGAGYATLDDATATLPGTDAVPAVAHLVPSTDTASLTGTCVASWYADSTSTGPAQATADHRSLVPGSSVRVTNLANGLSTVVRITGRAKAAAGRCLNLSQSAFAAVAKLRTGLINVRYEMLGEG
jgi:Lytic transglycolase